MGNLIPPLSNFDITPACKKQLEMPALEQFLPCNAPRPSQLLQIEPSHSPGELSQLQEIVKSSVEEHSAEAQAKLIEEREAEIRHFMLSRITLLVG